MLGTAILGAARRLSRQTPRLSAAARSVRMSAASSDAPAADVAPSEVPRKAGVTEGAWDKIDVQAVQEAEVDANRAGVVSTRLVGMSVKELEEMAESTGEKKYRGKQVHDALYKRKVQGLDDIVQVPKAWRAALRELGIDTGRSKVHHIAEAKDGTAKFLLKLEDGYVVETVGIPSFESSKPRLTVCVSSQVGCPMRCTFCATGKGGFARNLRPHEIVDQVLTIEAHFGRRVSNVVFMGMGEPLLNLRGVMAAHRALNVDVGIGARNMTISTVGVPNAILKMAEYEHQSTLAVSIHAPNQALREKLIPSARAYPIEALMEDCTEYWKRTGRRVSFEYTLLGGVNDAPAQAHELADLLYSHRLGGHVNLIPYNWVDDSEYKRPSNESVKSFLNVLMQRNVPASVRQTRGHEASAACGQLRNSFQKKGAAMEEGEGAEGESAVPV